MEALLFKQKSLLVVYIKKSTMTQITLNIEDARDVSLIKKLISRMNGITIAKAPRKRKSGYEQACEDIENGRVTEWDSTESMFKGLGINV